MTNRPLVLLSAIAAASLPAAAIADSELAFGGAGTTASADLDFEIIIPSFVYFQVGDPNAGTVDTVQFDLTGLSVGSGTDVPATAGAVPVVLRSNAANTEIVADISAGAPDDGGGNFIPFTEILPTAGGPIPVPAFGGAAINFGGPMNLTDDWTYTYDNVGSYLPGTYTTTVTYTATTL